MHGDVGNTCPGYCFIYPVIHCPCADVIDDISTFPDSCLCYTGLVSIYGDKYMWKFFSAPLEDRQDPGAFFFSCDFLSEWSCGQAPYIDDIGSLTDHLRYLFLGRLQMSSSAMLIKRIACGID